MDCGPHASPRKLSVPPARVVSMGDKGTPSACWTPFRSLGPKRAVRLWNVRGIKAREARSRHHFRRSDLSALSVCGLTEDKDTRSACSTPFRSLGPKRAVRLWTH
ncbi:hypothetical protein KIN20_015622 [Parelaphostrongylus tenuis]|uniref:Uncharacterized protein n=1 Tax=Parelaphostrongylus tenuis TaxID=148309 RepID=A0AAD5N4D4_PARTN|nr:hypothetical protein KIN20_015622 [Parelaphostrongylus tenuis]